MLEQESTFYSSKIKRDFSNFLRESSIRKDCNIKNQYIRLLEKSHKKEYPNTFSASNLSIYRRYWSLSSLYSNFVSNNWIESYLKVKPIKFLALLSHFIRIFTIWLNRTTRKILIKIWSISIRCKNRDKRSLNRFSNQSVPINLLEPRVWFNLLRTIRSQSVFWIFLKKTYQNIL